MAIEATVTTIGPSTVPSPEALTAVLVEVATIGPFTLPRVEVSVSAQFSYTPPTYEVRPHPAAGDAIVKGWGARAPGVTRGYSVISMDGVTFTAAAAVTTEAVAAANFYAPGGHVVTVTAEQKEAIQASGVGGTFVAVE